MTMRPPPAGPDLAGYRVEQLLGRGGMGEVHRALDMRLGRPVALKLLAPALGDDPRLRERLLRESRLAAGLDHPNVIPIYEAGEDEGRLFIAMRYVAGGDLKARLREGALDPGRAIAIADQVAAAADLVRRKDARVPAAVVRGLGHYVTAEDGPGAAALRRPPGEDLFRR
jgi:serine/threonine protein kinase